MLDYGNREHVACMAKINNTHKSFVKNLKKRDDIEDVGVNGRK